MDNNFSLGGHLSENINQIFGRPDLQPPQLPPLLEEIFLAEDAWLQLLLSQHTTNHSRHKALVIECGPGRLIKTVLDQGFAHAYGLDRQEHQIKQAAHSLRDYDNKTIEQAGWERVSHNLGRFDYILCLEAGLSSFAASEEKLFANMLDCCKVNGWIAVSAWAHEAEEEQLAAARLETKAELSEKCHIISDAAGSYVSRRFDLATIKSYFRQADLEPSEAEISPKLHLVFAQKKI